MPEPTAHTTRDGVKCFLGDQVKTLGELMDAARKRQAVIVPKARCFDVPRPAAFVINQTGSLLYRMFQDGIFIYHKATPTPAS